MRIIRGTDQTIPVTFSDDDGVINITGTTVYFTVKRKLTDTMPAIAKTITVHSNPTQGETAIVLSSAETDIESETYFWDLWIDNAGIKSATEYGTLEIIPSIKNAD